MLSKSRRKQGNWLQHSLPFWLILPTVLVLLVTQVYPGLYTIWLSLQTRRPTGWEFVGGSNYTRLSDMSLFGESVGPTIAFLIGFVSVTLVMGFLFALL